MKERTLLFNMAIVLFLGNGIAYAQDYRKGEVAFGWSLVQDLDIEETLPLGFHVGAAANLNRWFGIAGNFSWNKKSFEGTLFDFDLKLTSFSGGPRFSARGERLVGFFHVLLGGMNIATSADAPELSGDVTSFLIQPGGGVDFKATDNLRIRLQGDYQYPTKGDSHSKFRFVAAVVIGFGPR